MLLQRDGDRRGEAGRQRPAGDRDAMKAALVEVLRRTERDIAIGCALMRDQRPESE